MNQRQFGLDFLFLETLDPRVHCQQLICFFSENYYGATKTLKIEIL